MGRKILKLLLWLLAVATFPASASAGEINLSAAASLKEVINELADGYAGKNPAVRFRKSYGASGALARQVENGLPADIFISANLEWIDYLKNKKMLETGTLRTFTHNTLVFVGQGEKKVSAMQDLLKLNRIAVGSPKSVPAGEYAMEALKRAALDKPLSRKLVLAKDARDCLVYAERGEVDGAFVYRTDALQAKKVKILFTVPQQLYSSVTYPMALTLAGTRNGDAVAFYKYLQSEEAKAVLVKHGFPKK